MGNSAARPSEQVSTSPPSPPPPMGLSPDELTKHRFRFRLVELDADRLRIQSQIAARLAALATQRQRYAKAATPVEKDMTFQIIRDGHALLAPLAVQHKNKSEQIKLMALQLWTLEQQDDAATLRSFAEEFKRARPDLDQLDDILRAIDEAVSETRDMARALERTTAFGTTAMGGVDAQYAALREADAPTLDDELELEEALAADRAEAAEAAAAAAHQAPTPARLPLPPPPPTPASPAPVPTSVLSRVGDTLDSMATQLLPLMPSVPTDVPRPIAATPAAGASSSSGRSKQRVAAS